jgi:hypothetical protein
MLGPVYIPSVMQTHIAIARLSKLEKRRRAFASVALLCASVVPERAQAHPAAAESPTFLDAPCVTVVDKREAEYVDISYSVLMDDTAIEPGDIPVKDAKTHQFFALSGTIYQIGIDDFYVPFTDIEGKGLLFPLWITHSDVQRSAAAVEMASGVTAEQTDLPPARVLETRPDLDGQWLRITADDARRPITANQALLPVRWQLADVPAGVYTVSGYVFSPPYNAWAARPGVVKVVDADNDPAAGALDPVNEVVFAYQGRRVHGCVDVPDDTKLDAYYFLEEKPDLGWQPWIADKPIQSGDLELCFHVDQPDVVGSIRLRWDLHPPGDGAVTTIRTKDTFTWLPGSGDCTESATHCCDFPGKDAGPKDAGAAGAGGAGGSSADAGTPSQPAPAADSGGGCAVAERGAVPRHGVLCSAVSLLALAAARLLLRRRRVQRSVPTKSSSATLV